jgi:hypothetical protein
LLSFVVVLAASGLGLFVPMAATATPLPAITVSGDGVAMYPAFDPTVLRYGVTTTDQTDGDVTVNVPPGSTVNGVPTSGDVPVTGLGEGDEISVGIGGASYALVYLPAGFPAMTAAGNGAVAPGYLGVGLTTFAAGPSFEAVLDRNGVPVWVRSGANNDLKRQPNGELTVMRPTTDGSNGFTGYDLLTLDDQFTETARRHVQAPLTDTDNHDAQRLDDGSTILIGYEPRDDCATGFLDATIQKLDQAGNVTFTWTSQGLEDQSLNPLMWPPGSVCPRIDYAHINSVEEIPDGTHDLLVSFRHFSSVYRIATIAHDGYAAGEVVWRLGGRSSDFTFVNDDDFPTPGPCAQHNATWIGPDRVLLFDNGSVTLNGGTPDQSLAACVDPAHPTDPGIDRAQSRVSEYLLDPGAGTATLAWSYVPPTTFTFFAGSAARLANGDTLIGWASDRLTLATEVDAAADPVWSLGVDGNSVNDGYTSYRVSLVDYADQIDPAVEVGVPAGATFATDAVPPATWSCTDRGGSNLASCTVDGLVDGHLIGTPGVHVLTVTATDGAGNSTQVTRSYRVAEAFLPDGAIRKRGSDTWKGDNVYGPDGQAVRQRVARRHTATARWRVQNDGVRADTFRLAGPRSNHRWKVRYLLGGLDVTAAVVAGTYRTDTLAPGQQLTLRVVVKPKRTAKVGSTRTFTLTAASSADGAAVDAVATRVRLR